MESGRRAPVPLAVAVPQVVVAGLLTRWSFPDPGWWPLAVAGPALWVVAVAGRRAAPAAGLGLLYGLAFFVPLLQWSGVYVGPLPWLALATLQAAYVALAAVAVAVTAPRASWSTRHNLLATVTVAGVWTAQEALRDRTPFGGFPWGRLGFSQADSQFGHLAAWGGVPLVTFAVAATATALAWLVAVALPRFDSWRRADAVQLARPAAVAAVLALVGLAVPLPTSGAPVRVAGVQGDVPEPGLDFNAERRAVLDNHARETYALAQRVRTGAAPRPDVVIWPENSSDLDPFEQVDAREVIDDAVDTIGVPVLVGAVLQRPGDRLTNASIVWTPAQGPGAMYAKRHPVPFGEYIPYRSFFRRFSDKVDLVQRDFAPGHRPGVLRLGPVTAGVAICFEVAYDDLVRDTVRGGADLLVVQTNNATFGYTDEAVQQLAMSRLRAMEHGRAVAHVSTVGVSALIEPDGRVVRSSRLFTPAVLEAELPRRTALTVADRLGSWVELGLCLVGAAGVLVLGRRSRRIRSGSDDAPVVPRAVEHAEAG
ncbi:MAG: apolipoprotein N-acyltransferase [Angustibacter sp.]